MTTPSFFDGRSIALIGSANIDVDGLARSTSEAGASVPGRGVALVVMATVLLLTMSTWFSTSAVIPQLRLQWALDRDTASWLTVSVQMGFVIGAVGTSLFNVADIFSPKAVLLAGAVGAATANGLLILVDRVDVAILLRMLTGAFLAGVYPVALKMVSTWFVTGRGTALGIMVGALTLGSALPHLVNGIGGLGWREVILATSCITLAGAALAAVAMREGPFPFPTAVFDPRQAGQVWSNRGLRLASIGYFGHMWELYAMWAWFLVFFSAALVRGGYGDVSRAAPLATFAVIGVGALGCYVGGLLGDRWGRTKTTMLAMAISGTCAFFAGFLFAGPIWILLILSLIWGVSVIADSAQFSTIVSELADQAYVGTALTLQLAVGFALTVVTIWVIPILEAHWGWQWAFAILTPGPALGILAMLRLRALPEARKIAGGRG